VLAPFAARARAHPDGIVDLSIGTPVDPTPDVVRAALAAASDAPGYPRTVGSPMLQAAVQSWLRDRCHVRATVGVLPTIGSKELVAWLPTLLGLGPADPVVIPELAYPTYDVGARLAGSPVLRGDVEACGAADPPARLVWVNSPSNPSGRVLPPARLRTAVEWARARNAVLASDECYLELGWDAEPVSLLDEAVCGTDVTGLLVVHSLSKRSNLAGYRAGFVAGDPALIAELVEVRKHAGMIVPDPVQAAVVAALSDAGHVRAQRTRYAARRTALRAALEAAGFRIDHSEAGLYLWVSREEDCWSTVAWLAERGILVAPGAFYGPAGARHVRVALTATDAHVAAAVGRLVSG